MKKLQLIVSLLVASYAGLGQFSQSAILDVGSSTISSGNYFRAASVSAFAFNDFSAGAGFQWTFSNEVRKVFSGWYLQGGRDFILKNIPVRADVFLRINPYSNLTKESNVGFILGHARTHMDINFGYHIRRYVFNKELVETAGMQVPGDVSIWEYRNFIYRGTLRLKESDAPWNVSFSVTNYDHFIIQQETNPLFFVDAYYKITSSLRINSEVWYQGAGMLNLHPNHYGFYFRTGIEWQLGR